MGGGGSGVGIVGRSIGGGGGGGVEVGDGMRRLGSLQKHHHHPLITVSTPPGSGHFLGSGGGGGGGDLDLGAHRTPNSAPPQFGHITSRILAHATSSGRAEGIAMRPPPVPYTQAPAKKSTFAASKRKRARATHPTTADAPTTTLTQQQQRQQQQRQQQQYPQGQQRQHDAAVEQAHTQAAASASMADVANRVINLREVVSRYREETKAVNEWRVGAMWEIDIEAGQVVAAAEIRLAQHAALLTEVFTLPHSETERAGVARNVEGLLANGHGRDGELRGGAEQDQGDEQHERRGLAVHADEINASETVAPEGTEGNSVTFASLVKRLEAAVSEGEIVACTREYEVAFGRRLVPEWSAAQRAQQRTLHQSSFSAVAVAVAVPAAEAGGGREMDSSNGNGDAAPTREDSGNSLFRKVHINYPEGWEKGMFGMDEGRDIRNREDEEGSASEVLETSIKARGGTASYFSL